MGWDIETDRINAFEEGSTILTSSWYGAVSPTHQSISVVMDEEWDKWRYDSSATARRDGISLMDDPTVMLVGHNLIGFDVPWWQYHVGPIQAGLFDTQVAYSLLDETGENNSLVGLIEMFMPDYRFLPVMKEMKKVRGSLRDHDAAQVLVYNTYDAQASLKLHFKLTDELVRRDLMDLFWFLMDVGKVLANMMTSGVNIDRFHLRNSRQTLSLQRDGNKRLFEEIVADFIEDEFNLNSTKQLGELLFGKLKMPVLDTTKSGAPSTASATIKKLAAQAEDGSPVQHLLDALLTYRGANKLLNTYVDPLSGPMLDPKGKVHTTYHLAKSKFGGTVTGRLSSSKPNLQNIPRDKTVKGAFVPKGGWRMYEADYSQLELRVAAWYANEESMQQAFREGRDIHTQTLAEIKGVDYTTAVANVVSGKWKEDRALIKRINFGILYGASAPKIAELAQDMGVKVTIRKAQQYVKKWYEVRPNLKDWIAATEDEIMANKRVMTPTGRIRRLPQAGRSNGYAQGQLRQGVNFMIQSLASDITLAALRSVAQSSWDGHELLLTVHDSLVGQYNPMTWTADGLKELLRNQMIYGALGTLPTDEDLGELILDVDINTNLLRWGD